MLSFVEYVEYSLSEVNFYENYEKNVDVAPCSYFLTIFYESI